MFKIGILREEKVPSDARVALNPKQCKSIHENYAGKVQIIVQSSSVRCIPDSEYIAEGIQVQEDLSACDILLGIKEVPIDKLIPNKTYYFFSHTTKKQEHNRKLLQAILEKNITLIDYERLTNSDNVRVIAFGRWAGIVGAHNGMMAYGKRTGSFDLPQMNHFKTFADATAFYKTIKLPAMRIAVTGAGRVSSGVQTTLEAMGIRFVTPHVYLTQTFEEPIYTQLSSQYYVQHKETGAAFDIQDFYKNPQNYESIFEPYTKCTDLLINGIFWDKNAPVFFTKEDMLGEDFAIQTIADITCDIAPASSIPSTLYASTIEKPVFGYDPKTNTAVEPYRADVVDVMSIDNLPSELPIDASGAFGEQFIKSVLPEIVEDHDNNKMINRATITKNGHLTEDYLYLEDYVKGHNIVS